MNGPAAAAGLITRSDDVDLDEVAAAARSKFPPRIPARDAHDVSVRGAMSIASFYRAFFVYEATTAQLSIDVRRKIGDRREVLDAPPLVRKPDPNRTQMAWVLDTIISLASQGNAYWRKRRGSDGSIVSVEVLHPLHVGISTNRHGRAVYTYDGTDITADVVPLAIMKLPGALTGLGPIQAYRAGLGNILDVRAYVDGWLGTHPDGWLSTDQKLTQEQANALVDMWLESQSMDAPAILSNGLKYFPFALKPAEIQWIEAQEFSITDVARLMGIPGSLMLASLEGQSSTYRNQQQEDLAFVRYTLMRYLREIEVAITEHLLPRGSEARFNLDAFLRPDITTRYEAHKIALDSKFLTVDEVREIEGYAPLPERTTAHA